MTLSKAQGSSPRMRGTLRREWRVAFEPGIIPAYAGNTCSCNAFFSFVRDHPRVCGEHPVRVLARSETSGIIPAYAGNTTIAPIGWAKVWDHPRVCGEHEM